MLSPRVTSAVRDDRWPAFPNYSTSSRSGILTIYKMNVPANVPVDGFWSISLYTAKGFFEKNPYDAYSHLGAGCDGIQIHLVVGIVVVVRDRDRKSTRLNSSHLGISYAVFCLKK